MAFSTDAAILEALTQLDLDSTSAAVSSGAFSVAGDLALFTNTERALTASFVLSVDFATAPAANKFVHLYARLMDIVSTTDAEVPTANHRNIPVCSFPIKDVATAQLIPVANVVIPSVKQAQIIEFYIENGTDLSMPAGWIVYATQLAILPAA